MNKATQNKVRRELVKALKRDGFKGWMLEQLVNEGMSGKLSDIDDIVAVNKFKGVRV